MKSRPQLHLVSINTVTGYVMFLWWLHFPCRRSPAGSTVLILQIKWKTCISFNKRQICAHEHTHTHKHNLTEVIQYFRINKHQWMLFCIVVGGTALTSAHMLISGNKEIYIQETGKSSYWTSYELAIGTHTLQSSKLLSLWKSSKKRNFIWWSCTEKLIQFGKQYQSDMYRHKPFDGRCV
jgi:hypothetical protein